MTEIVITGARGYVGSALTKVLVADEQRVKEFDLDWFQRPYSSQEEKEPSRDFSEVTDEELSKCDTLIHLAAVSNDPMGAKFNALTHENNVKKTRELLHRCSEVGVSKVIFASSCSVYGTRGEGPKTELSVTNPLTAYSKSKVEIENEILNISQGTSNRTQFVVLRFATAAGPSENFRVDLVLNDFVWSAVSDGVIQIMSDGSPLRPIIDVRDMAKSMNWAQKTQLEDKYTLFNVGQNVNNFSVRELADMVAEQISDVEIRSVGNQIDDRRSYEVEFDRFQERADFTFTPIQKTITDLESQVRLLQAEGHERDTFVRLAALDQLLEGN